MLKKLGFRMGSLKHIQAPLLHQSQWVLLTDRQKVGLCSKYEGFYHFSDRTDSDMLLYIYMNMRFINPTSRGGAFNARPEQKWQF